MNTKRLSLVLGSAILASSCLFGGGGFKPSSPDPVVWVDSDKHDWGTLSGAETVEHVFSVRNMGGAPLNITRVQTSCGCTAAVLDHQYLKPGEETRLKVTFDPRGRHGAQTRTVWIHSNDPKNPQKQLVISASITEMPLPVPVVTTTVTGAATAPTPSVTASPTPVPTVPAVSAPAAAPVPPAAQAGSAPAAATGTAPAPKPAGQ
ncbi:MAG: DUF1573 domain-containing protein [Candidatus Coatesbacteria bacterium]